MRARDTVGLTHDYPKKASSLQGRMNPMKIAALILLISTAGHAAELHIGASTVSITPDKPVALAGQFHTRISRKPETPIIAN